VNRSAAGRLAAVAAAVLIGGLALAAPPAARAADASTLQIVTSTTYTAVPAEKHITVTIDAVATNLTPDPPNGRYYYSGARFAVQPDIQDLTAASAGTPLVASVVSSTAQFTTIEIAFGRALYHGQSISFQATFDIVDPGGTPQRDVRVAASLVAFPVWAFGSEATPGSSVTVVIPAGYTVTVEQGSLTSSTGAGGTTVLTAKALPDPYAFFAYVTAERPGAFVAKTAIIQFRDGPVPILIRSWADDPQWGTEVTDLLTRGLPSLRNLIGLPYKVRSELTVEEAATSRLGDYAGLFNYVTDTMDVRYDADAYTVLHEAAHTWFNANLFPDRWIDEAWAEYYGVQVGTIIGVTGQVFTLTPDLLKAKIPLNSWGQVGSEPTNTEDYAYAASYHLAELVAARTDTAGLQAVWRAAADGEASYQPAHPGAAPETGSAPTVAGWQRLLDLLEERTGVNYDDLWRTWVVTAAQQQEMDARVTARADYSQTVTAAGDWELPYAVRYTLGAWQFGQTELLLADANAVLTDRTRIANQATTLSLSVPDTLRAAFEAGPTFGAAKVVANDELGALNAIGSATRDIAREPTPLEWVGLLFANPSSSLDQARSSFEDGDATRATAQANAARAERDGAAADGRLRLGAAGGSVLVLDGLAMGGLAIRRRRTARARARTVAAQESDPQAPLTRP
jgi:hypothetical protein